MSFSSTRKSFEPMKAMDVGWLNPVTTVLTDKFGSSMDGPVAWFVTVVVMVDELSLVSGSVSVALTLAVLISWPVDWGVTAIVTVAELPLAKLPRLQLTAVVPLQVPCVGVAETKFTPAGRVSATVAFVAGDGPLLVTMMR